MEKRAVIGTLIVLIALAVIGFLIYMVFYHESETSVTETPYGNSLEEPVTYEHWEATWEAILNSDAAYLQDPDFDVTADNFYQSVRDLLTAPARLFFYSTDDQIEFSYKCDSLKARTEFTGIFQGLSLTECSEEKYRAMADSEYNTGIYFWNIAGYFEIRCYHDHSFIWMNRRHMNTDLFTGDYFYVGENLHDKVMTAYEKLLPYSMECSAHDVDGYVYD